jgi:hypothetical protein
MSSTSPRWQGLYLVDSGLCNYRLDVDAELVRGARDVVGYGYAIAPRANVLGGVPTGPAIQYDVGFHGLRYPNYPRD